MINKQYCFYLSLVLYPSLFCSNMYRTVSQSIDLPKNVPIALAIGIGGENVRILSKLVECWIAPDQKNNTVSIIIWCT